MLYNNKKMLVQTMKVLCLLVELLSQKILHRVSVDVFNLGLQKRRLKMTENNFFK